MNKYGDHAVAAAIQAAHANLIAKGWNFSNNDIAKNAKSMLDIIYSDGETKK